MAYEIQQIDAFQMLDRTVGLVNDATDLTFLQSTLAAAAASAPTGTRSAFGSCMWPAGVSRPGHS